MRLKKIDKFSKIVSFVVLSVFVLKILSDISYNLPTMIIWHQNEVKKSD